MRKRMRLVAVLFAAAMIAGAAWAREKPAVGQEKDRPSAAAADPVSGEWAGTVTMPDGGAMPFSMKLKLELGKVTGEVGNEQGAAPITAGSFAEGKVAISFTYVDGSAVELTGSMGEGQAAGNLNYGVGQMMTTWVAKRKAAQ